MKKKFLALMLSFAMVMSMTACGGKDADTSGSSAPASDNADETESADETGSGDETDSADEGGDESEGGLVYNEANGLKIGLPADFSEADGGVEGLVAFANADRTAFVTVSGPLANDTTDPDQLTEEAFAAMFEQGGYSDVVVDNAGAVDQPDGANTVTAFGTGTMPQDDGSKEMNIVMQYYFMADGSGLYIVNYAYPLDDTATDDAITDILASVTVE